jgi:cyclopropane fatty-acyl-phospholipid synthase-like methyltransferase
VSTVERVDFEARYREDPDPWGYTRSGYERDKYAATLAACGPGTFGSALELGASIGVFSALLAPRCRRLVTVDLAPTAVATALERLTGRPGVEVVCGAVPDAVPPGPYDLVVASEILYYLEPEELERTFALLRDVTAPGARVVAVHWRPAGPERPFDASTVHDALSRNRWLRPLDLGGTDDYLLDVFERR